MGQTSSQLAPNQGQEALNERAPCRTVASPKQSSRAMAGRKHARLPSLYDEAAVRTPKHVKTKDDQEARKERRRSVPQHRRGTAIMPSQDLSIKGSAEQRPSTSSSNDSSNDNIVVASPQKPSFGQKDRVRALKMKNAVGDGIVVNPIGRPGPRKQKQTKQQNNESMSEDVNERPQLPMPSALDQDKAVEPATQLGAAQVTTSGLTEQQEAGKPAQQADAEQPTTNVTTTRRRKRENFDIVEVNPVGRPGPSRRKKPKHSPNVPDNLPDDVDQNANAGFTTLRARAKAQQPDVVKTDDQLPAAAADCIPTPPSSAEEQYHEASEHIADRHVNVEDDADEHDGNYDATIRERYVDPTNQISGWLNSQVSPAPPDQLPPSMGSPQQTSQNPASNERKRLRTNDEGSHDEYQDDAKQDEDALSEVETKPKARSRKKSTTAKKSGAPQASSKAGPTEAEARGVVKGAWSEDDKILADTIFERTCKRFNASANDMKYWISDWGENWSGCVSFRADMLEAFPFRKTAAIRKFCQRRWHHWETGPWTAEEDRALIEWHAIYPGQWCEISGQVERTQEACRDRWVRVLQHAETKEKGPWTVEREQELVEAVTQLREVLKSECQDEDVKNDTERLDKLINWEKCSEILGGKRNAKTCQEKWKILKRRAAVEPNLSPQQSFPLKIGDQQALSKKNKATESAYNKLGWGDVFDAVCEVSSAFLKNPAETFPLESTVWSIVATRNPNSKFPSKVRRRCYYGLLEKLSDDEDVQKAVGFGVKAIKATFKLDQLFEEGILEDNRFAKEVQKTRKDGDKGATKVAQPTTPRKHVRNPGMLSAFDTAGELDIAERFGLRNNHLSAEFINDSDDEPEVDAGDQAQLAEMLEVPETQEADDVDASAGAAEEMEAEKEEDLDDLQVSSVNSRDEGSLRSATPQLTPDEFVARCTAAGRRQHREYVRAVLGE